ncbi:MAG: restriction endonuclease subunit S [Nitrosopumilus sp.]|uniref:restriction endonuclease subunit S n=1 Tax=Nitrosopumilus sp. TaxID=2024843 RepID=UPI00247BC044|nr:restriction endonuclease subunit S [Nitrosopumilus sp.]MCV0392106.1 restriction endonuclease subunit S [Nitrosopumilus sp.]
MRKPRPGYKLVKSLFGKYEEIPEEWELKKIKELTKVSVGLVINPSTYFDDHGTVPMITGKHVTENGIVLDGVDFITEENNRLLEPTRIWLGDLVTMRVGYPGRTSVVRKEHDGINCASVIITRKNKKFVSEFLGYLANSKLISKQVTMYQAGGAQQVVNVGSWKEFLIFLPPIPEQEKIASTLSNVDDLISSYDKTIEHTKQLKKGLMQTLLTKGIGHKKFKKVKWLFGKEIEIPEEWYFVPLSDLIELKNGFAFKSDYFVTSSDKVVITPGNFHKDKKLYFEDRNTTFYEGPIPSGFILENNDLLIVMTDLTRDGVILGNAIILKSDYTILHNQRIAKVLLKEKINKKYLNQFLNSSFYKKQIKRTSAGTGVIHTSTKKILEILFPHPEISEQQKIASILSNIDSKINELEGKKTSLESLKKRLMQKLLTGQIRVKI